MAAALCDNLRVAAMRTAVCRRPPELPQCGRWGGFLPGVTFYSGPASPGAARSLSWMFNSCALAHWRISWRSSPAGLGPSILPEVLLSSSCSWKTARRQKNSSRTLQRISASMEHSPFLQHFSDSRTDSALLMETIGWLPTSFCAPFLKLPGHKHNSSTARKDAGLARAFPAAHQRKNNSSRLPAHPK